MKNPPLISHANRIVPVVALACGCCYCDAPRAICSRSNDLGDWRADKVSASDDLALVTEEWLKSRRAPYGPDDLMLAVPLLHRSGTSVLCSSICIEIHMLMG